MQLRSVCARTYVHRATPQLILQEPASTYVDFFFLKFQMNWKQHNVPLSTFYFVIFFQKQTMAIHIKSQKTTMNVNHISWWDSNPRSSDSELLRWPLHHAAAPGSEKYYLFSWMNRFRVSQTNRFIQKLTKEEKKHFYIHHTMIVLLNFVPKFRPKMFHKNDSWGQSYDLELKLQCCKNLQRHGGLPTTSTKQKCVLLHLKTFYYNAGVVIVNAELLGLAPGHPLWLNHDSRKVLLSSVARWFIFKQKILIWVYFDGP
jgi:hypothetical protein